jgi:hypothetical protein
MCNKNPYNKSMEVLLIMFKIYSLILIFLCGFMPIAGMELTPTLPSPPRYNTSIADDARDIMGDFDATLFSALPEALPIDFDFTPQSPCVDHNGFIPTLDSDSDSNNEFDHLLNGIRASIIIPCVSNSTLSTTGTKRQSKRKRTESDDDENSEIQKYKPLGPITAFIPLINEIRLHSGHLLKTEYQVESKNLPMHQCPILGCDTISKAKKINHAKETLFIHLARHHSAIIPSTIKPTVDEILNTYKNTQKSNKIRRVSKTHSALPSV